MHAIERIDIEGTPPPWGVTAIGGFVRSALDRVEREGGELPAEFCVSFCPWGERNAALQAIEAIADVFEPRFRLVHRPGLLRRVLARRPVPVRPRLPVESRPAAAELRPAE